MLKIINSGNLPLLKTIRLNAAVKKVVAPTRLSILIDPAPGFMSLMCGGMAGMS